MSQVGAKEQVNIITLLVFSSPSSNVFHVTHPVLTTLCTGAYSHGVGLGFVEPAVLQCASTQRATPSILPTCILSSFFRRLGLLSLPWISPPSSKRNRFCFHPHSFTPPFPPTFTAHTQAHARVKPRSSSSSSSSNTRHWPHVACSKQAPLRQQPSSPFLLLLA